MLTTTTSAEVHIALQGRVSANGRVGATSAVYSAAILGESSKFGMGIYPPSVVSRNQL